MAEHGYQSYTPHCHRLHLPCRPHTPPVTFSSSFPSLLLPPQFLPAHALAPRRPVALAAVRRSSCRLPRAAGLMQWWHSAALPCWQPLKAANTLYWHGAGRSGEGGGSRRCCVEHHCGTRVGAGAKEEGLPHAHWGYLRALCYVCAPTRILGNKLNS